MYRLETENFLLELLPGIHQDNFPYPKANRLRVKVSSLGFSADSIMDIDDIALSDFAVNLNELYETLSGSVRLEEPYSMHCFLEFTAVTGGHIRIKGRIYNKKGIGYGHEL
ncbi:hypothetical protein, partial [Dialister invisus]|uniref:hypothetical protein n=1 Tax=Dialister invisus TaxID=218538 RepID=UPI0028D4219C